MSLIFPFPPIFFFTLYLSSIYAFFSLSLDSPSTFLSYSLSPFSNFSSPFDLFHVSCLHPPFVFFCVFLLTLFHFFNYSSLPSLNTSPIPLYFPPLPDFPLIFMLTFFLPNSLSPLYTPLSHPLTRPFIQPSHSCLFSSSHSSLIPLCHSLSLTFFPSFCHLSFSLNLPRSFTRTFLLHPSSALPISRFLSLSLSPSPSPRLSPSCIVCVCVCLLVRSCVALRLTEAEVGSEERAP